MYGPPALFVYSLWLSIVSGSVGAIIGMIVTRWLNRRTPLLPADSSSKHEDGSGAPAYPGSSEIEDLLEMIVKINSQVDDCVDLHTERVDQIAEDLKSTAADDREQLIRATRLLVSANQQLKDDLANAQSELKDQRQLVDSFKVESRTDALTQVLNRRAFESELSEQIRKLQADGVGFSLMMVDVDHFKQINDRFGHLNGDQVLSSVAHCLKSSLNVPGTIARYGGEEFVVIVPQVTSSGSIQIAEDLRIAIEKFPNQIDGSTVLVTASIGVSMAVPGDDRTSLIERADQALFEAKNSGRNRCCYRDSHGISNNPHAKFGGLPDHQMPLDLIQKSMSIRERQSSR